MNKGQQWKSIFSIFTGNPRKIAIIPELRTPPSRPQNETCRSNDFSTPFFLRKIVGKFPLYNEFFAEKFPRKKDVVALGKSLTKPTTNSVPLYRFLFSTRFRSPDHLLKIKSMGERDRVCSRNNPLKWSATLTESRIFTRRRPSHLETSKIRGRAVNFTAENAEKNWP